MAIVGLMGWMAQAVVAKPSSFCVDYSAEPGAASLLAHEVCILDPAAKIDPATLKKGRDLGIHYLAYLSLVEIDPKAAYFSRFESAGIRTLGENTEWGTKLVDLTDPNWPPFFLSLAKEAQAKGFGSFFLDTADSVERLVGIQPQKKADFTAALVGLVKALRQAFPDGEIVVNRGFAQLDAWRGSVNGILAESVFAACDPVTRNYYSVSTADSQWIVNHLDRAKAAGLDTYILDYVEPGKLERVWEVEKLIRETGAIPFISTPELQGDSPLLKEFKRKILVLYGHDPKLEEMPQVSSPLDASAQAILQATMEWMGYEFVYHLIVDDLPKPGELNDYAGIVLDDSLKIPLVEELAFANWLNDNVQAGKKLIFLGGYPFEDDLSLKVAFKHLGLQDGEEWPLPVTKTEMVIHDPGMMDFETKTVASTMDFRHTLSPPGSQVHLRLQDVSGESSQARFYDAVYSCSWGGAILAPYLSFDVSEESQLFYVNIPKFLATLFPSDHWPVPDVTTRDGLRIFYSHIDGDGFTSDSSVIPDSICGEVLYEKVLKDFPYPITVSIIEATLVAHMLDQESKDITRYQDVARKIFALPQVEPASHSYSHPYIWDLDNIEAEKDLYDSLNLPLKLSARYPKIDLKREIQGSLEFIHKNLVSADKPPAIMLWSGNCRPTPETVALADAAGVENMNGGDTVICKRFPGLGNVSGKLIAMRGRIQILASNQNEFIYTNGWRGPYFGGFSQVIETFEKTETPVRLKPVNVYYHFYSADRPAALRALQKIYAWCGKQELHAMTAAEYAALVRDSHHTRMFQTGQNRWSMVNEGKMRTIRIANHLGFPNLEASCGIVGFHRHEEWTYIHTDGSPRVELALSPVAPGHAYLQSSDNPIVVNETSREGMAFTVGKRTARVKLVQLPVDQPIVTTLNEIPVQVQTDRAGALSLELEPGTHFRVVY